MSAHHQPRSPPPPLTTTTLSEKDTPTSYNSSTDIDISPTHIKPIPHLIKTTSNTSTTTTTTTTYLRQPPSSNTTTQQRSPSADTLSLFSTDDLHELRRSLSHTAAAVLEQPEISGDGVVVAEEGVPLSRLGKSWVRNKGLVWVAVAQFFATLMNITTRLLEGGTNGGDGMHPFQILFARMSITFALSMLYMWYQKIPHFPFGAKEVRLLLVARGLGGFFGVFGLYWSLQYLPLSDATVLTFLAPCLSSYLCSKLLREPFTRIEQIGGFVSLLGVILIARPTYIFSSHSTPPPIDAAADATTGTHEPTPTQRLAAVGMGMVGVLGATSAYTTIRWIGKRAHPLISVNYFAFWCTVVSFIALAFIPSIPFVLPSTPKEWTLLFFIGVSGFVMQFLLTAGLRYEKSSRATNMVYTQLLFALGADELVFGATPGLWSLAGSALILGSAVVVAVQKEVAASSGPKKDGGAGGVVASAGPVGAPTPGAAARDEEMGLVEGDEWAGSGDESAGGGDDGKRGRKHYSHDHDDNPEAATTSLEMHEIRR